MNNKKNQRQFTCLSRRNYTDVNWKQVESINYKRFAHWHKRFGELKKSIGKVSQKVLTTQLRDMEESGLISRKVYAEVPPKVEYSLTELGKSLQPILDAMLHWGAEYKEKK